MKKRVEVDENDGYISYKNDLSNLSLHELRKVIKNNLANDNNYLPFTKEWEWEQCCCYHVE